MIEWLQNFSGLKTSGINMERMELESLRKEMAKYKKKYEKEDDEMRVHTESVIIKKNYFIPKIKLQLLIYF